MLRRVERGAVHERSRGRDAGAGVECEGNGGLGLRADRLVNSAALIASEDVAKAGERGILAGHGEAVSLDALGLQVLDNRGAVLVVGHDNSVDVRMGGVLLLELGESNSRGPGAGGDFTGLELANERVLARLEVRGEHGVIAVGEQRGVVVGIGTVHDEHDGLGHLPGVNAADEAIADEGADAVTLLNET